MDRKNVWILLPGIKINAAAALTICLPSAGGTQRPAGLAPGVEPALDVAGGGNSRLLGGLHRHGRALAEGAIEHDAPAGRAGELVEHAARPDISREIRIGRVQRARDDAVALALAPLAQVDEPRRATSSWASPTRMLAGTATSIIFGFGSLRLLISSTYSSTVLTCRRGLKARSSPMVETVSPL